MLVVGGRRCEKAVDEARSRLSWAKGTLERDAELVGALTDDKRQASISVRRDSLKVHLLGFEAE